MRTLHRRPILVTGVTLAAVLAAGIPLLTTTPSSAGTATPCGNTVTALSVASTDGFASGGKIRRLNATVDFPGRTGFYDQSGRVMLGKYPAGSVPTLLNTPVGDRATVGSQVKSQRPTALAAINGDFFVYRTIRGNAVEFSRGPMIRDGVVVRADKQQLKVVGVDSTGKPFGGTVGIRGSIRIGTGPRTSLAGVNWDAVQGGGVTLYTTTYSKSSGSPRPAGASEWVINGRNKIVEVRTSTINAGPAWPRGGEQHSCARVSDHACVCRCCWRRGSARAREYVAGDQHRSDAQNGCRTRRESGESVA